MTFESTKKGRMKLQLKWHFVEDVIHFQISVSFR